MRRTWKNISGMSTVDELTRIYCMVSIAKQKKITLTDKERSSVSKAAKEYYDSLNEAEKKFTKADLSDIESAYEHYAIAQSCTILYRRR